jgi:GTPase Era involved in 16S rRNA processing
LLVCQTHFLFKNIECLCLYIKGNKEDKYDDREVPERVGKEFANANGFEYFLETSALNSTNVDSLFHEVAHRLTQDMRENEERYKFQHLQI